MIENNDYLLHVAEELALRMITYARNVATGTGPVRNAEDWSAAMDRFKRYNDFFYRVVVQLEDNQKLEQEILKADIYPI